MTGIDNSLEMVRFSSLNYGDKNTEFHYMDLEKVNYTTEKKVLRGKSEKVESNIMSSFITLALGTLLCLKLNCKNQLIQLRVF